MRTNELLAAGGSEARDPTFVGRLACLTQGMFATIIGALASSVGSSSPDFLPRGLVLLGIFGLPAVVGLLGVRGRRPALLVAAALTAGLGSFIAFSGVSLIFLVPATLFAFGAVKLAGPGDGGGARRSSWWPLRLIAQAGLAATLFGLMVGAGSAALLVTDEGCWTTTLTPTGVGYALEPMATGEVSLPEGVGAYGCSSGLISARGVALGGVLAGGAIGLGYLTSRRRLAMPG